MNRTPSAILFAAGREVIRQLVVLGEDDTAGRATVIAAVASDYGIAVEELENEVRDRTEDDFEDDGAAAADAADEEAMYGAPDHDEPTYGPARLRDDDYYARNDAGEYRWM